MIRTLIRADRIAAPASTRAPVRAWQKAWPCPWPRLALLGALALLGPALAPGPAFAASVSADSPGASKCRDSMPVLWKTS